MRRTSQRDVSLDCIKVTDFYMLPVIRSTRDLQSVAYPAMLGTIAMKRSGFVFLGPGASESQQEKENAMSDREAHWAIAAMIDPAYGGKGVVNVSPHPRVPGRGILMSNGTSRGTGRIDICNPPILPSQHPLLSRSTHLCLFRAQFSLSADAPKIRIQRHGHFP